MISDKKPFQQLTLEQQTVAIDLSVACSLVITRLPSISQTIFDLILRDFAAQYNVPLNVARYALRACGQTLFQTAWTCTVDKNAENILATHFRQEPEPAGGENGEQPQ